MGAGAGTVTCIPSSCMKASLARFTCQCTRKSLGAFHVTVSWFRIVMCAWTQPPWPSS